MIIYEVSYNNNTGSVWLCIINIFTYYYSVPVWVCMMYNTLILSYEKLRSLSVQQQSWYDDHHLAAWYKCWILLLFFGRALLFEGMNTRIYVRIGLQFCEFSNGWNVDLTAVLLKALLYVNIDTRNFNYPLLISILRVLTVSITENRCNT